MTLLESLVMAHLLGDWLLQTEWQARHKAEHWRALLTHLAIYHVPMAAVLLWRGDPRSPWLYLALVFLVVTHAVMDRKTPVVGLMRLLRIIGERPPERWLTVAVDQAIHLLLLGLVTVVLKAVGAAA